MKPQKLFVFFAFYFLLSFFLKAQEPLSDENVAYLGIYRNGYVLDEFLRQNLDLKQGWGLGSLDPEGPAAKAGLKKYDIILAIDGLPINNFEQIAHKIISCRPGQKIKIEILRQGKKKVIGISLGSRPKKPLVLRKFPQNKELDSKNFKPSTLHQIQANEDQSVMDFYSVLQSLQGGDHSRALLSALKRSNKGFSFYQVESGLFIFTKVEGQSLFTIFDQDNKLILGQGTYEDVKKLGGAWPKVITQFLENRK